MCTRATAATRRPAARAAFAVTGPMQTTFVRAGGFLLRSFMNARAVPPLAIGRDTSSHVLKDRAMQALMLVRIAQVWRLRRNRDPQGEHGPGGVRGWGRLHCTPKT